MTRARRGPVSVPANYDLIQQVSALQALNRGEATADQQHRALKYIIEQIAITDESTYRTDPYDHAFCSGRRAVGLKIRELLEVDLAALNRKKES